MYATLGQRVWLTALTGIPFAIYKMGGGWYVLHHISPPLGVAMMLWGGLDILINVCSALLPQRCSYCLLSNLGRQLQRRGWHANGEAVLLGVDTLLSFTIVAAMIGFGALPLQPVVAGNIWNLAVICNVLAVGLIQIREALREQSHREITGGAD